MEGARGPRLKETLLQMYRGGTTDGATASSDQAGNQAMIQKLIQNFIWI